MGVGVAEGPPVGHATKPTKTRLALRSPLAALKVARGGDAARLAWTLTAASLGLGERRSGLFEARIRVCDRDLRLFLRHSGSDAHVFQQVFLDGIYEWAYPRPEGRQPVVVDLGANIGLAAVYFAARLPGARLVCVEPVPENVAVLRKTLAANGLEATVFPAAVTAQDGTATFHVSSWWSTGTTRESIARRRRTERGRAEFREDWRELTVPARSLASLVRELDLPVVDVLKVDIEGEEERLLAGNPPWLELVRTIVLDLHQRDVDVGATLGAIRDAGFALVSSATPRSLIFTREV
jgi:FkbM family methyltransferase